MKIPGVELVILVGLPAAGKTTFCQQHLAATHDHVSKDLFRTNRRPQRRQEILVAEALASGRSVVVDNTNPSAAVRAPLIDIGRRHGAIITGVYFPTTAADALRRNRTREGPQRVPDVAIFTARKRLEPPTRAEGFDRLFVARLDESNRRFEVSPLP
jgi:predicted kinase